MEPSVELVQERRDVRLQLLVRGAKQREPVLLLAFKLFGWVDPALVKNAVELHRRGGGGEGGEDECELRRTKQT